MSCYCGSYDSQKVERNDRELPAFPRGEDRKPLGSAPEDSLTTKRRMMSSTRRNSREFCEFDARYGKLGHFRSERTGERKHRLAKIPQRSADQRAHAKIITRDTIFHRVNRDATATGNYAMSDLFEQERMHPAIVRRLDDMCRVIEV